MNQPRPSLAPLPLDGERVIISDGADLSTQIESAALTGATHLRIETLTPALLADLAPTLVILPLISGGSDAAQGIEHLESLQYQGRILVLAPALPKPRLVERELRALGPGPRLMLITPQDGG